MPTKLVKTYKGYINYYIKKDVAGTVKTHYFNRLRLSEVNKLVTQFQNPDKYTYKGIVSTRDKDKEV